MSLKIIDYFGINVQGIYYVRLDSYLGVISCKHYSFRQHTTKNNVYNLQFIVKITDIRCVFMPI